ncbi:hypothetical protein FOL47_004696 [Perkinsus chesapeaki]|uniref:Uncharacterized protein n=1 Tax=Perkinsus chesapeaki TaxID=330153 RepID=A0A7J6M1C5_PERCH|nr:hypothetical protein FOL47_004696 [Perkinsus chesapeaki]
MLSILLLNLAGVAVTIAKETKFYCHFYQELQSVCLQKVGDELKSISKHTVHAFKSNPAEPLYTSITWPTRLSFNGRAGILGIPDDVLLPWPADHYATFRKTVVFEGPTYYDMSFKEEEDNKRFTKLMPISAHTIDRDGRSNNILGEFISDLPQPLVATVTRAENGEISTNISYTLRKGGKVNLEKVKSTDDVRVMVLKRGPIKAKAFFFRLPTKTVQYGLMVYTENKCIILYKADQIRLRGHHKLSPG